MALLPDAVHGVSTVRAGSPVTVANSVVAAWTSRGPPEREADRLPGAVAVGALDVVHRPEVGGK